MRQRGELTAAVRGILRREWDPIGIGDLAAADEYDAYVVAVARLIEKKASPDRIAQYLRHIAETQMETSGNETPTRAAAEKLAALR